MPDITKCTNSDCKQREQCWRFMAPNNHFNQAFARFEPVNGKCEYKIDYDRDNRQAK